MQKSWIHRFWRHRLFVSVAWSETGAVRGLYLRSAWAVMAILFVCLSLLSVGRLTGQMSAGMLSAMSKAGLSAEYVEKLNSMKSEKVAQDQQLQTFAQELGDLQARLDRFDALSEKLLSKTPASAVSTRRATEQHRGEVDGQEEGNGDHIEVSAAEQPDADVTLAELAEEISVARERANSVEAMVQSGIQMLLASQGTQETRPYLWPVVHPNAKFTSSFGARFDPFRHDRVKFHGGIDIGAAMGASIVAAADGVVTYAGYKSDYGNMVEVRHASGFTTRYGHMSKGIAHIGQQVRAGDLIGLMGSTGRSTGPHLHFEVLVGEVKVDPLPFVRETQDYVHDIALRTGGARRNSYLG